MYDYNLIIRQSSERVFEVMAPRVSPEDLERIKDAFALAQEKHAAQKRKSAHRTYGASSHRRNVVHLSDVRLRASVVRRD